MSTAILTGPPVAGEHLLSDLRALGFTVVAAEDDDVAARVGAVPAGERVALVDTRLVAHRHALRLALTDPRFPAAAVPGAVTAQPAARAALLRALAAAPAGAAAGEGPAGRPAGTPGPHPGTGATATGATGTRPAPAARTAAGPVPDAAAAALLAAGEPVHRPELGVLTATVPTGPAERERALAAVAETDDEKVRLRTAVKARDGFFTTFFVSPYSRYLARWCARRGLTPNQVTTASLVTALIAAGCAATGTRPGFAAAGLLLLLSFVLDCTDGQLARYSLQYSTLGAWLDATFDRAKEYAFYAGLALGAARGGDDVWALALAAMILQTVRHVVDFAFTEADHDAPGNTSPAAALSGRLDSVGWTVWARRMIVLPIGERWALTAVLTALTTPRTVFYALLIGSALAGCYTTAGRLLRSLARRGPRTDRAGRALADLADSGPLAEAAARALRSPARTLPALLGAPAAALLATALILLTAALTPFGGPWPAVAALGYAALSGLAVARPLTGPLDWLVPPLFRAAEYGTILVLAARAQTDGALPAAFGLVAAAAYHHYDTVYRIRGGTGAPPAWLVRAVGGQEGRVLAVTAAALLPASGFTIALTALAAVVALAVLAESVRFWVSSGAPAVHDESGEPA
ncbi:CDP-alcohol phosphatidyltransferase family protein [Streptomyces sp. F63]|uniref:DUF5941 domain-containing protein n=1 Tax=Streptomyces sp. F63 TaxID=2824887 RepID=UPI001B374F62|nr:DUF5941 domain-containing protein [Streptomyces sp. F63]MBQ0985835.1 CDP-alcohol phosphatidyltransferase family protein [Streptomyces sp. F63]